MVNTIFTVKGLDEPFDIEVEGCGQATCSAALKIYKNYVVVLKGFIDKTTNIFLPAKIKR